MASPNMPTLRQAQLAILFALIVGFCACDNSGDPATDEAKEYILGFVSIVGDSVATVGTDVGIRFDMLMPDTCNRYGRYGLVINSTRYDFTLWGIQEPGPCILELYVAQFTYTIANAEPGGYRIVVHLADGDSVVHSVRVD